jgi:hypothetical protein
MKDEPRRFPAPWDADKIPGGYVIRDANKQALAYVYARATSADPRRPRCLPRTRHGALLSTSRGYQTCCATQIVRRKCGDYPCYDGRHGEEIRCPWAGA